MKRGRHCAATVWLLLSLLLLSAPLALAAPHPIAGRTHTVRPGDTLGELAARYGTSVEAIAAANDLPNPDLISVGERLLIPGPAIEFPATLPDPITALYMSSEAPIQGQTWTIAVEASRPLTLTGTFDDRALHWVAEEVDTGGEWRYWALAGVHALAKPGPHSLALEALDGHAKQWMLSADVLVQAGDFDTGHIYLSPATSELLDPQLLRRERERLAAIWAVSASEPLWQGHFAIPVRPMWSVTSRFGQRRSYNDGPVSSSHAGVDYGAKQGALVLAPAAGQVVLAEQLTVRGNAVILDHGAGVHSGYWHLWRIFVEEGDEVAQGDPLGRVGSTGLSTGDHLHWELRVGDVAVHPLQWTREVMPQIENEE